MMDDGKGREMPAGNLAGHGTFWQSLTDDGQRGRQITGFEVRVRAIAALCQGVVAVVIRPERGAEAERELTARRCRRRTRTTPSRLVHRPVPCPRPTSSSSTSPQTQR